MHDPIGEYMDERTLIELNGRYENRRIVANRYTGNLMI